ncbi:GNAT family N-acetyltransferase [Myxococcus fulvus]|uniref:GNAT family N-acetyltransferase n=1 Tax=Myxococcus fulvus TaxID=33 RepID=UPI0020C03073|nr:GNAT family N-acetyltransferase [Myxococcus fulvus]MCK8500641.1 GNAT family N-acetyltransferase [Myxococcus fulvus]
MIHGLEQVDTERLRLRAFRESDVEAMFELHSDPRTNLVDASAAMSTREEARELLSRWLGDWAERGVGYWAVERREAPGVVVGVGGVRHKPLEGRTVLNLAYRFFPSTWGSGFATEVSRVALEKARLHLPEVPLVAIIHPDNVPSIRVAERLGLRFERIIPYGTGDVPHRLYVVG